MDDDDQQFNLRWHSHQDSVITALGRMYAAGALTDVTLSANGTVLRAHRLVLASCSQYFAQLFKEVEADSNTLVVVLGCDAMELKLLLSFMYTGEVTASRRTLPALLRLAKTLKVAGLTDADCTNPTFIPLEQEPKPEAKDEQTKSNSPINLESRSEQNDSNSLPPDNNNSFSFNFEQFSGNVERDRWASESVTPFSGRCEERLSKLDQIVQNLYSTHRIDAPVQNLPVTPPELTGFDEQTESFDRKWRHGSVCSICNKRLSNQYNLRVHLETHAGGRHACRACSHVSRSRDALRKHVAYRHPAAAGKRNTTL